MLNEKLNAKHELQLFAERVNERARANLAAKNKNASGRLSASLEERLQVFNRSFSLEFLAADYADFIDQGVKGAGGVIKSGKNKGKSWNKRKVKSDSPYSYDGKRPPASAFDRWNIFRGRAGRDEKGKFLPRKSLNFATATSVFHRGIETTNFFTDAVNLEILGLPAKLTEAYALDAEEMIETTFRDHLK